jgi:hypothetical protein
MIAGASPAFPASRDAVVVTFAAQAGGSGTLHPTSGDTFTVTSSTGGASSTLTGHF